MKPEEYREDYEALAEYEKRFGECPVSVLDGGGPDEFLKKLRTALLNNEPIPDPYTDIEDGVILA